MEKELEFALDLLGITLEQLRLKMFLTNKNSIASDNDECVTTYSSVYTDGACPNNGFNATQAGIGVFFGDNDSRNISSRVNISNPTNNRAELMAILLALQTTTENLEICSDSQYCINAITKWMKNWKKNNWKSSSGTLVKNKEFFLQIDQELVKNNRHVVFRHVSNNNHKKPSNKHNKDHYGNYMADKLANDALL